MLWGARDWWQHCVMDDHLEKSRTFCYQRNNLFLDLTVYSCDWQSKYTLRKPSKKTINSLDHQNLFLKAVFLMIVTSVMRGDVGVRGRIEVRQRSMTFIKGVICIQGARCMKDARCMKCAQRCEMHERYASKGARCIKGVQSCMTRHVYCKSVGKEQTDSEVSTWTRALQKTRWLALLCWFRV